MLAARSADRLSIAAVDVDHSKHVDDHFGHASGDLVRRGVADVWILTLFRATPPA